MRQLLQQPTLQDLWIYSLAVLVTYPALRQL